MERGEGAAHKRPRECSTSSDGSEQDAGHQHKLARHVEAEGAADPPTPLQPVKDATIGSRSVSGGGCKAALQLSLEPYIESEIRSINVTTGEETIVEPTDPDVDLARKLHQLRDAGFFVKKPKAETDVAAIQNEEEGDAQKQVGTVFVKARTSLLRAYAEVQMIYDVMALAKTQKYLTVHRVAPSSDQPATTQGEDGIRMLQRLTQLRKQLSESREVLARTARTIDADVESNLRFYKELGKIGQRWVLRWSPRRDIYVEASHKTAGSTFNTPFDVVLKKKEGPLSTIGLADPALVESEPLPSSDTAKQQLAVVEALAPANAQEEHTVSVSILITKNDCSHAAVCSSDSWDDSGDATSSLAQQIVKATHKTSFARELFARLSQEAFQSTALNVLRAFDDTVEIKIAPRISLAVALVPRTKTRESGDRLPLAKDTEAHGAALPARVANDNGWEVDDEVQGSNHWRTHTQLLDSLMRLSLNERHNRQRHFIETDQKRSDQQRFPFKQSLLQSPLETIVSLSLHSEVVEQLKRNLMSLQCRLLDHSGIILAVHWQSSPHRSPLHSSAIIEVYPHRYSRATNIIKHDRAVFGIHIESGAVTLRRANGMCMQVTPMQLGKLLLRDITVRRVETIIKAARAIGFTDHCDETRAVLFPMAVVFRDSNSPRRICVVCEETAEAGTSITVTAYSRSPNDGFVPTPSEEAAEPKSRKGNTQSSTYSANWDTIPGACATAKLVYIARVTSQ